MKCKKSQFDPQTIYYVPILGTLIYIYSLMTLMDTISTDNNDN